MGKSISLFSGYSQKENRTTNYCLLALKMIYEENPKFLSEILSGLCGYDVSDDVGVKFRQQEKKGNSVPDGLITQKAFTIFIETKNFDWFYDKQLENHLDALNTESQGLKVLFALGNFEGEVATRFSGIKGLCENKFKNKIFFSAVTFEDFITALDLPALPKNISDAIKDLRTYLDEEGLIPSWKNWLDVVNCAGLPEDVLLGKVYMCPAEGGAYSHGRCKFFGMYRQKSKRCLNPTQGETGSANCFLSTLYGSSALKFSSVIASGRCSNRYFRYQYGSSPFDLAVSIKL